MEHFNAIRPALVRWEDEADDLEFWARVRRSICELKPNVYRHLYEGAKQKGITIEEMAMHILTIRCEGGRAGLTETEPEEHAGHA